MFAPIVHVPVGLIILQEMAIFGQPLNILHRPDSAMDRTERAFVFESNSRAGSPYIDGPALKPVLWTVEAPKSRLRIIVVHETITPALPRIVMSADIAVLHFTPL